jgi:hypothetical protein
MANDSFKLTDNTAPAAPTINAPIAVTYSATPTFTGTGTPGSTINISDVTYRLAFGGSAYKQVTTNRGTATVGVDGTWSFTVGTSHGSNGNALVTENLDATIYNFVVSETNAACIISNTVKSSALVLDQTAPLIDFTTPSNPVLLPPTIDGFIYVSPTNPSNDSDSSMLVTVTDVDTLNGMVTTTTATTTAVDGTTR